mmetsp:Transcript_7225/g.15636  ORF Transcript_7225/g.15636 Transcript_7225/m.15636 type:complete len:237 (-) Transcript_7225:11-721(-)
MQIKLKPMSGDAIEVDVQPQTSIAELKLMVKAKTYIPVSEQRLVYAGSQLEEKATQAWLDKQTKSSSALAVAMGNAELQLGSPLTLENYGITKGSVINIVRSVPSSASRALPEVPSALDELSVRLRALSDSDLHQLLQPLLEQRRDLRNSLAESLSGNMTAGAGVASVGILDAGGYKEGELVEVYSKSMQRWCNGVVRKIAMQTQGRLLEGSVEVEFEGAEKWIPPGDLNTMLRRR